MSRHDADLALTHQAVDLAARLFRDVAPGVITAKADRDLASETDTTIERRVREFLAEKTPTIGFLGEEDGHHGDRDRFWVLDPVDGTSNFLRRMPLCGISLALVEEDTPVVGVIDLPLLGSRYAAAQGTGASMNGADIYVSHTRHLHEAIVSTGDYAVGGNGEEKNRVRLALTALLSRRAERVRMLGSAAVDLAWLAHGHLDATITLSNKPWDMAAGTLIAREAGADIVDRDGTPHTLSATATIAAAPALTGEVLALLTEATVSVEQQPAPKPTA